MSQYLNPHPAHVDYLNLSRLEVGFRAHYFGLNVEEIDAVPATAAVRAKQAVQEGISRLERLAKSTAYTDDAKHEAAKVIYEGVRKEVTASIDRIRSHGKRESQAATDRAFAVLNDADTALHGEIRAYLREQAAKGDPEWPARLDELVRTSLNTAAAINAADSYLSGVSDARKTGLRVAALKAHAPDDFAAFEANTALVAEADRMTDGLARLERAFFTSAHADRATASQVDVNAPLVPGEPATVGG